MDFCASYFGKPLAELSYEDISNYFTEPRIENATIEFKSYAERSTFDTGLQKVIRGISSFLNSNGGVLIWGAPSATAENGKEAFVGNLCPVKELKDKDSLINRIGSAITPLPIGINIQILVDGCNYLYVFEVQESPYKPHQYEYQYFIRLDGQSRPAPHYVVEALLRRITYPNVCGVIKFHKIEPVRNINGVFNGDSLAVSVGLFNFTELQNEEKVFFRLLCVGGFFPRGNGAIQRTTSPMYINGASELIFENFADVLHFGTPRIHVDQIAFNRQTLKETGGMLHLLLSFGGKKSPAKMSRYTLDLNGEIVNDDPNPLLTECEENILFADTAKKLNKSREDSLNAFTER